MVEERRRPKPSKIDVAEELGFNSQRVPEIGPGSHKPNMGRGGLDLPSEDYYDLKVTVPMKKGIGIPAPSKKKDSSGNTSSKPRWSDLF